MPGSNENDYFRSHDGKDEMPCIIFLMPEEVKMPCHVFRSKLSALGPRSGVSGLKQKVPGFMGLERRRRGERERSGFSPLWMRQRKKDLHSFLSESWMHVNEILHTLQCRPVRKSLANRDHSTCALFSLSPLFPVETYTRDTVQAKPRGRLGLPRRNYLY